MSKKTVHFIGALALVLLVGAGCASGEEQNSQNAVAPQQETDKQDQIQVEVEGDNGGMVNVEVVPSDNVSNVQNKVEAQEPATQDAEILTTEKKVFNISGKNFAFMMDGKENPDIRVKRGDIVRVEFMSDSGFHDWVVDEFGAATTKVQAGGTTFVEFVASEKGTFEYYCSVGQHRANGMKGNLIVE